MNINQTIYNDYNDLNNNIEHTNYLDNTDKKTNSIKHKKSCENNGNNIIEKNLKNRVIVDFTFIRKNWLT